MKYFRHEIFAIYGSIIIFIDNVTNSADGAHSILPPTSSVSMAVHIRQVHAGSDWYIPSFLSETV